MLGQLEGLASIGLDVYALFTSMNRLRLVHFIENQLIDVHVWEPIAKEGEQQRFWQLGQQALHMIQPDAVYARYESMFAEPVLKTFFQAAKQLGIQTCLEFPTFPYDKEIQDVTRVELDQNNRRQTMKYVDRVFTTSTHKIIDGVPCSGFTNQVSNEFLDNASTSQLPLISQTDSTIHVMVVANFNHWHGFDRALRGLSDYYTNHPSDLPKVILHFVGEGESTAQLQQLTDELELHQVVRFHGYKHAEELKDMYQWASLGLASLGLHRIGIFTSSTLKVREYLANGLPLIYCCEDHALSEFGYALRIPQDESAVDFKQVVESTLVWSKQPQLRETIRHFAKTNLSWRSFGGLVKEQIERYVESIHKGAVDVD